MPPSQRRDIFLAVVALCTVAALGEISTGLAIRCLLRACDPGTLALQWDVQLPVLLGGILFGFTAYSIWFRRPAFISRGTWVLTGALVCSVASTILTMWHQHLASLSIAAFTIAAALLIGAVMFWWNRQYPHFAND